MRTLVHPLENGLPVVLVPMPSLTSVTVMVWAKTGAAYELPNEHGISHFLEHMTFKGGKRYKTPKSVSTAIDSIGGESNASTGKDYTDFYIRVRSERIKTAIDILADTILNSKLAPQDIEREKGVIIEEINMYEDMPLYKIGDLFESALYQGTSLEHDITGSKNNVRSFTQDDFVAYKDKHYFAENMLVTVAGGFEPAVVLKLVHNAFGGVSSRGKASPPPVYRKRGSYPKISLTTKTTEQGTLLVGFLAGRYGNPDMWAELVLATLLGDGMSSRLYMQVREKRGLAYSISADMNYYARAGSLSAGAGVDPKKAVEALKVIMYELQRIASPSHGITERELAKAKEYIKGHFALYLESTRAVTQYFGYEQLMLGKVREPEDYYRHIEAVTVQDVASAAGELVRKDSLALAVIGPFTDPEPFLKVIGN